MRDAALPIDWGFLPLPPIRSYVCVFSFHRRKNMLNLVYELGCLRVYVLVLRTYSGSRGWRKRDEKNAGTNLGTVRMEMPCRCYSHLHSDFRYKPLCPRPPWLLLIRAPPSRTPCHAVLCSFLFVLFVLLRYLGFAFLSSAIGVFFFTEAELTTG